MIVPALPVYCAVSKRLYTNISQLLGHVKLTFDLTVNDKLRLHQTGGQQLLFCLQGYYAVKYRVFLSDTATKFKKGTNEEPIELGGF